jgi:hypothetical protein
MSLGNHPPTEGHCQMWAGIRIDDGTFGAAKLDGINVAVMFEIPGLMSRGNWTSALFVDEAASPEAMRGLETIFSGKAGGSTSLLSILVGTELGTKQLPVVYRTDGDTRVVSIDRILDGAISPVRGKDKGRNIEIRNTEYWISPDITVAQADKSRFRAFGRNWNFTGRSAEICRLDWGNRKG